MEKTNVQRKSGDTDAEREQAATIIQAFYRGYRVRKELKKKEKEEQQKEEKEEQQKEEKEQQKEEDAGSTPTKPWLSGTMRKVIKVAAPVAVGVGAVVATPVVIGALGFGTAGIAAGSVAAKGMSLAATTGYGMSVISALQSIGAAGLTTFQALTVGGAVATGVRVGISGSDSSSTTTSSSDSSSTTTTATTTTSSDSSSTTTTTSSDSSSTTTSSSSDSSSTTTTTTSSSDSSSTSSGTEDKKKTP